MNTNHRTLPIDTADARACTALIAGLPLTNAREAHQTLIRLLTGLAHRPPPAPAYLEVLEAMRAPLAFLQDELARTYAAKPCRRRRSRRKTSGRFWPCGRTWHAPMPRWRSSARASGRSRTGWR